MMQCHISQVVRAQEHFVGDVPWVNLPCVSLHILAYFDLLDGFLWFRANNIQARDLAAIRSKLA